MPASDHGIYRTLVTYTLTVCALLCGIFMVPSAHALRATCQSVTTLAGPQLRGGCTELAHADNRRVTVSPIVGNSHVQGEFFSPTLTPQHLKLRLEMQVHGACASVEVHAWHWGTGQPQTLFVPATLPWTDTLFTIVPANPSGLIRAGDGAIHVGVVTQRVAGSTQACKVAIDLLEMNVVPAQCTDECAPVNAVVCDGAMVATCGQYDSDPCLDIGGHSTCDDGVACTTDTCVPNSGCQHVPDDSLCTDSDLCTADTCVLGSGCVQSPEPGPCQWPGQWGHSAQNPVLTATTTLVAQGADNIYAADVLSYNGQWWMWYGGQGSNGHDQIFVAHSSDLVDWQKYPSWTTPQPVVPNGASNHVNDPSVVHVGGTFYMYYTDASVNEADRIHLATSSDGINWVKHGLVLDVGPSNSWEPDRVGRPAVLHEDGEFRMWYDGQIFGVARHVGYATSPDGFTWTKHPANPVLLHQGAIDVDRVGDWYVLLAEGHQGTKLFVSRDRLTWQYVGLLFGLSGQAYDAYGQVTPFLLTDNGAAVAVFYGGASDTCWCHNRIAVAFPVGADVPGCAACRTASQPSCQAGCEAAGHFSGHCGTPGSTNPSACCACEPWPDCSACLGAHASCDAACQAAGAPSGSCAHPGSSNPAQCCACDAWTNCQGCLGSHSSCDEACQYAGAPGGSCANPSSTDPGNCCACLPDTGCENCLVGHPTCMAACQAAGQNGGWCATPGSTNPSACCACF